MTDIAKYLSSIVAASIIAGGAAMAQYDSGTPSTTTATPSGTSTPKATTKVKKTKQAKAKKTTTETKGTATPK
jgi:hypothetical protein